MVGVISDCWAQSARDPSAFEREQAALAHVWTFLGFTADLRQEGDWFRASIGTRSVFVQKMAGGIKGFENRCAHRQYPLRTKWKGNGPIVCPFHHWRYDADGRALGVPICEATFGVVSRALGARLELLDIAICGKLIFGRFPAETAQQTLEEYLGDGFPILAALSGTTVRPWHFQRPIQANWKLCMHLHLDDYHPPAVHPTTFGKTGYLDRKSITYTRFGLHNAFLNSSRPDAFARLVAASRDGSARSECYMILQLMPDLVLSHVRADGTYFHCILIQSVPLAFDRSLQRVWIYPSPLLMTQGWQTRLLDPITNPFRRMFVGMNARRILDEDASISEGLQTFSSGLSKAPRLGALEERIVWFEEAYRNLLASTRTSE